MKTLRYMTVILAALALLFSLSVLTAAAADVTNTSPDAAAYIDSQTHPIAANTTLWYRFDYAGDLSQITITMPNGNASGLAFNVRTPMEISDWWETAPVGRGSAKGDDLLWTGNFNAPGTYYVEVINNNASGMGFQLNIQGSGVTLGSAGVGGAGAPAPAPSAPALNYTPSTGPVMNTDPGHATVMDNQAHTIAANTAVWYRFAYAGDKSQIAIVLPNGNVSGVQFNVWTAQGASDWWDLQPVGRGTAMSVNCTTGAPEEKTGCFANDLNWNGNFDLSGTYYVQVVNTTASPVSAMLTIQGDGVTLGQ